MSVQTSYSREMTKAFAGMIADAHLNHSIETKVNAEASAEIPFGVFVAKKATGGDLTAVLPATNGTLPICGLVLHSDTYSKGDDGELGDTGLIPLALLDVMVKGRAWVNVLEAVDYADPVHVVYAGARPKGSVAPATTASETFLLKNARFITSTSGAGVACIEFDCLAGVTPGA